MSDLTAGHRVYAFGDFVLDLDRGALLSAGSEVKLRPKSFDVLRCLVLRPGRLVTRNDLMDEVWGQSVVTDDSLTQCIIEIRRALGDTDQRIIRTVPRRGFIFELPVSEQSSENRTSPVATESTHDGMLAAPRGVPASRWLIPVLLAAILLAIAAAYWLSDRLLPGQQGSAESAAQRPANSIAVLPFLDLSADGDQQYFADGLAEEILHRLTQSPDLRVTARTSSFTFRPGVADVKTIADRLDVAYVVEGSVRRAADKLRITVQLIDTKTRSHLWSRTYDRPFEDVLAIQDDIATDVAGALRVPLRPVRVAPRSGSPQAHDLFLHGNFLFNRRNPGDLEAAERYLQQAVALDPDHARAWTSLAGVYSVRGLQEIGDPKYRLQEQRSALDRALAIDPTLAEAHVRMSRYLRVVGDETAARISLERAILSQPDEPIVLFAQAHRAMMEGQIDEAVRLEQRAVAVDPLSSVSRHNFGLTLLAAGRLEEALAQLELSHGLSRRDDTEIEMSRALLLLGRKPDAIRMSRQVADGLRKDQLEVLLHGRLVAAAAWERLRSDGSANTQLLLAEIASYHGETDTAVAWLDKAVSQVRASGPMSQPARLTAIDIMSSPFLRPLHSDPRWRSVVAGLQ